VIPLRVATLNVRNRADRWDERLPLLLADMAALQPDLLGLQEVVYPLQQDRLLGAAGERRYASHRAWAGRPEYGNALLVAEGIAISEIERLDLGLNRAALRGVVTTTEAALLMAVTHLHHVTAEEAERDEQARRLLESLDAGPVTDAQVVVGDFNAEPDEPASERFRSHGFRSAYAEANGADADVTWPSGIQAPGMDTDGPAGCLDYIWIRGEIRVDSARLVFDRPAVGDPTLYPSDDVGIVAELNVGSVDRSEG
jgi:endonuclease/exonuclease/phosphatase family metal-dependent hydrolase